MPKGESAGLEEGRIQRQYGNRGWAYAGGAVIAAVSFAGLLIIAGDNLPDLSPDGDGAVEAGSTPSTKTSPVGQSPQAPSTSPVASEQVAGENDTKNPFGSQRSIHGPNGSEEVAEGVKEVRAKGGYWSQFAPSTPGDTTHNLAQLRLHAEPTGCYGTYEGVRYEVWASKSDPDLYHYIPVRG